MKYEMMPAGKYYIGDLCYVLDTDLTEWNEICDLTCGDNGCIDGTFVTASGRAFAMFGTAHGDGTYPMGEFSLGVDSGTIGCILVDDISEVGKKSLNDGAVVDMETPFNVGSADGKIFFGSLVVNTNENVFEFDPDDADESEEIGDDEKMVRLGMN